MAQEPTTRPAARRRTRAAIASVNLRLVRKIIEDVAPSALAALPDEALTDQEREIVSFVRGHYQAHGRFPSAVTLEERRIILPDAPEPLEFYQQAAENAIKVRIAAEAMLSAQEALNNNDGDAAMAALRVAYEPTSTRRSRSLGDHLAGLRETMRPRNNVNHIIPYGVPVLDNYLGGLAAGDMAVIYGRPGNGKTMLQVASALSMAEHGQRVMFITKEMTEPQIVHRMTALYLDFDPRFGMQRPLSTRAYTDIMHRMDTQLPESILNNIIIPDATRVRHPDDILALIREDGPTVIALDGGYFMKARGRVTSQRESYEEIIRGIKQIAVETNLPFLMTWQQNRGKNNAGTDGIYGTDALSQDASTAVEIRELPGFPALRKGIVTKNRHGPGNTVFGMTYSFKPTQIGQEMPLPLRRGLRGDSPEDAARAAEYAERAIRSQRERP